MEQTGAFSLGYSDFPEAVHGTGTNPIAKGHHAPEMFNPAVSGIWNGNQGGSLTNATVPWWRRHWIIVLVLAVVIVGGAIGGGCGGALVSEKKKNDSQLVAPLTGTGLGVTMYVLSCSFLGVRRYWDSKTLQKAVLLGDLAKIVRSLVERFVKDVLV
jgi:hypothetical protein